MQNIEQMNSEVRELTETDLETINGGNIFGDIGRWIVRHLKGDGDLRRSLDRPQ